VLVDKPVDGLARQPFPGVPELATVDGELAIEQPIDQGEARVFRGIGFAGDQVINLGQHIADIQGLEGSPTTFFVVGSRVIDIKIMEIGDVTS
jgi:hypothetical protein